MAERLDELRSRLESAADTAAACEEAALAPQLVREIRHVRREGERAYNLAGVGSERAEAFGGAAHDGGAQVLSRGRAICRRKRLRSEGVGSVRVRPFRRVDVHKNPCRPGGGYPGKGVTTVTGRSSAGSRGLLLALGRRRLPYF